MCGILGAISGRIDTDAFSRALDHIAHRGPDAFGITSKPFGEHILHLGHRRLSIIDLSSAANQPFEKDGLSLIFNGEIYNYQALRDELIALGAQFTTHSDTETILEGWRKWGMDLLPRLRGMFAFALHDAAANMLTLARDPFGIKPLYLWQGNAGELAFASELKALLPLLPEKPELAYDALVSSLIYCWLPSDQCIYQGVHKLPPASWMQINASGQVTRGTYWDARHALIEAEHVPMTVEGLRDVIESSIAAHMVADVPISTFLSGGLDSSIITVLAAQKAGSLDSYTIGFRAQDKQFEAMPDDLLYARQLAKTHNIRLHEIEVAPDAAHMLPQMVAMMDEPIGDSAAINTYLICKAARDAGVKVLLSGMGADELFGGYRRHYACMLAARYRRTVPAWARSILSEGVARLPVAGEKRGYKLNRWAHRFLSFADMEEEAAYMRSYTYYDQPEIEALMGAQAAPAFKGARASHAAIYNNGPADDAVNRMCFTDMHRFMEGLNQTYCDRASMAASTEIRVPFIDLHVAEAAFAMPGAAKIRGSQQKAMLKKAAEAWLPQDIIYRPKASFGTPLRAWIRGELREMVDDQLRGGELVKGGYLQGDALARMIDDDRAGRADYAQHIWQLLTAEQWMRQYKNRHHTTP